MPSRAKVPAHLAGRVRNLRSRLRSLGVDAILVTNPVDIRYLTGFVGDDSWALIPTGGQKVYILSDSRFDVQIDRQAPHAVKVLREKSLPEALKQLLTKVGVKKIGLQPAYTTLASHKALVAVVGASKLKQIEDGLIDQRAVKTDDEVKLIRKAARIQQQAMQAMIEADVLRPGATEQAVAAWLEHHIRTLGADGVSFPTIVAADANAALPHAIPGKTKLKKHGMVLIDWGAKVGGYCSDMTRVFAFGRMPAKVREIYQVCLDAQLAGIAAIAPGASLKVVDEAARKVIVEAGYGDAFGHSLGHGIGLDIHEQPTLSPRGEGQLKPGHVVTVEPGIYLPGIGGVRIEDDVLVTDRGSRVLTHLPKSLDSAII